MAGKRIMKIKKKGTEEQEPEQEIIQENKEHQEHQEVQTDFDIELKKMMTESIEKDVVVKQEPKIIDVVSHINTRVPIPISSNRPSIVTTRRAL